MARLKPSTTLLQAKKTATGIQIPPALVEQLGAGKRPPVKVSINGHTYRSTIAAMGGIFMPGVSADVREKAGVKGGDKIVVELELDTATREVTVPADLQKAMKKNLKAQAFFDTLSFSNKQRYVLPIETAKRKKPTTGE